MRKSMTAYGRAFLQTQRARWIFEISSVNRKGLDVHLHLPHLLLFLDPTIRKWVGMCAERGSVTIRVLCEMKEVIHLVQQLKNEKKRWETIAQELDLPLSHITLPFLLEQITPDEVTLDHKVYERELAQAWKKASKAWITMKEQEGKILAQDIQLRLKIIQNEIKGIEKELPNIVKLRLAKLSQRMEELKINIDIEQLKTEAALQADRDDVTEEIIRLKSHIDQMVHYLRSSERSVGRTLDFLAQEMGRETSTLMAKAGSSDIAKRAVRIKSEVEKIREQVQNLE